MSEIRGEEEVVVRVEEEDNSCTDNALQTTTTPSSTTQLLTPKGGDGEGKAATRGRRLSVDDERNSSNHSGDNGSRRNSATQRRTSSSSAVHHPRRRRSSTSQQAPAFSSSNQRKRSNLRKDEAAARRRSKSSGGEAHVNIVVEDEAGGVSQGANDHRQEHHHHHDGEEGGDNFDEGGDADDNDNVEDEDKKDRLCGIINLIAVHEFEADENIEWDVISLDQAPVLLNFREAIVEEEFTRFMYRDPMTLALSAVWIGGCIIFIPILGLVHIWSLYMNIIGTIAQVPLFAVEFYSHFVAPQTRENARRRMIASSLIAFVGLCVCSSTAAYLGDVCHRAYDVLEEWFGVKPNTSLEHRRQYCYDIICPFVTLAQCVLLVFARLKWPVAFLLGIFHFILMIVGYVARDDDGASKLTIKLVFYLLASTVGVGLTTVRDIHMRRQFIQHIELVAGALALRKQQDAIDRMLTAMLPSSVLSRIMNNLPVADSNPAATMYYSDIASFTKWCSTRSATQVVTMLNFLCVQFDFASAQHRVEKVKTIGDAYWAVCGLPEPFFEHADSMCRFGLKCISIVKQQNDEHPEWEGINIRIGIHSGSVAGGVLGNQQVSYEVFGNANHVAEQVEQQGVKGEVVISGKTEELLRSKSDFLLMKNYDLNLDGFDAPVPSFMVKPKASSTLKVGGGSDDGASQVSYQSSMVSDWSDNAATREERKKRQKFLRSLHKKRQQQQRKEQQQQQQQHKSTDHDALTMTITVSSPTREALSSSLNDEPSSPGFLSSSTLGGDLSASPTMAAAEETTTEEVVESIGQRKYRYFLMRFAKDAVEQEYQEFALTETRRVVTTGRFILLFCLVVVLALTLSENPTVYVDSIVLYTLALLCNVGILVASFLGDPVKRKPLVDALIMSLVCTMVLVSLGRIPRSLATNDITYLGPILGTILCVSITAAPSVYVVALFVVFIFAPIIVLVLDAFYILSDILFNLVFALCVFPAAYLTEKLQRQQFIEHYASVQNTKKLKVEKELQESLLLTIVPQHVIRDIMRWFDSGQTIEESITKMFPCLAVAFLQVHAKSSALTSKDVFVSPDDIMKFVVGSQHAVENIFREYSDAVCKIKTVGDILLVAGPMKETPNTRSSNGDPKSKEEDAGEAGEREHEMKEVVKQEQDESEFIEARYSALCLVRALVKIRKKLADTVSIQCGLNAGPVVGAVIGTDRLSFDVFGDTINTSSRAMSTSRSANDVMMTEAFFSLFLQDERHHVKAIQGGRVEIDEEQLPPPTPSDLPAGYAKDFGVGESYQQEMKGKGKIRVYPVLNP